MVGTTAEFLRHAAMRGERTAALARLLLAGLLLQGPAFTEPVPVGLDEAKRIALERNEMLRAARSQMDAMEARKLQSWAGHLPSIRISENALRTNDAVNAFGFKLKQEGFTQADFAIDALNRSSGVLPMSAS